MANTKPRSASKARPKHKSRSTSPPDHLRKELESIVAEPDRWLNTPNDQFGGRAPVELIGTEDEHYLREWVGAIQHGMPS